MSELRQRYVGTKSSESSDDEDGIAKNESLICDDTRHYYGIVHFGVSAALFLLLVSILNSYTTYLPPSKPINAPITEFSGDRAREHLENIARIGPRPSGSYANDIEAVRYILNQLSRIKENASKDYDIEIELQTASGSFAFFRESNYIQLGFTSTYENISNVVAKITPKKGTNVHVLANAHYDTVMNTEGASDDTVSCAVLIEAFRAISSSPVGDMKHGVIFLFNGAEEGGLSGSHAFIQHRWFSSIRVVVNVEAAGSGGREFVFQTGPDHPWILATYASAAKYPYASIVAQEIFQAGVVPSDTDFRVFVDYGNLVGVDIAFISNGYVYHTRNDNAQAIPSGSLQRAGDNIYELLKAIVRSDYLENPDSYKHGSSVFFDVLGLFVIHYPARLHTIMSNLTCAVVLLYMISLSLQQYSSTAVQRYSSKPVTVVNRIGTVSCSSLLLSTFTILFAWILAFAVSIAVALFLTKLNMKMMWYSYPKFALVLYGIPALLGLLIGHLVGNVQMRKVCDLSVISFVHGHLIIYSGILCVMNYYGLLSSFLVWFWIVFPFAATLLLKQLTFHPSYDLLAYVLILASWVIPVMLTMYYIDTLFVFFGPLMGRVGTEVPSEVVMACLSALSVVVVTTFPICLYHNVKQMKTLVYFIFTCCVLVILYTLSGHTKPYYAQGPVTPKRVWLQHTLRTFHTSDGSIRKQDSGIWIQPMDATGFDHLGTLDFFKAAEKFECDGSYCGLPYYYPMRRIVKEHWYLRGDKPDGNFEPLSTQVYNRVEGANGVVRYSFNITGPDHMNMFLTLKENVTVDWSMYKSPGGQLYKMDDEMGGEVYFVFYSHGYYSKNWNFWIQLQRPPGAASRSVDLAELGIARHYLHGSNARTSYLNLAIRQLPEWMCDNSWTSNYDSFTLA